MGEQGRALPPSSSPAASRAICRSAQALESGKESVARACQGRSNTPNAAAPSSQLSPRNTPAPSSQQPQRPWRQVSWSLSRTHGGGGGAVSRVQRVGKGTSGRRRNGRAFFSRWSLLLGHTPRGGRRGRCVRCPGGGRAGARVWGGENAVSTFRCDAGRWRRFFFPSQASSFVETARQLLHTGGTLLVTAHDFTRHTSPPGDDTVRKNTRGSKNAPPRTPEKRFSLFFPTTSNTLLLLSPVASPHTPPLKADAQQGGITNTLHAKKQGGQKKSAPAGWRKKIG